MGHSRPLFLYFRLFNTVDSKQCSNFAYDGIRTADFGRRKWPLCQLSHHHCPIIILSYIGNNFFDELFRWQYMGIF